LFPALAPALPPAPPPALPPLPEPPSVSVPIPQSSGDANLEQGVGAVETGSLTVTTTAEAVVVGEVALASSNSTNSNTGRWVGIAAVFILIGFMAGGAWVQTRRSR
jgi:hypothetical protein